MKVSSVTFSQEMHCCGPTHEDPAFTIEVHDGGGGEYIVLHAAHWSISDEADLKDLHAELTRMLKSCASV
jgi:hypothetical protein